MKGSQGFTLVELLVAIAILGLIIVAIGALLPGLAGVNRASAQQQTTVLAARAYFEQVRSQLKNSFSSALPAPTATPGVTCTTSESQRYSAVDTTLRVSRTVTLNCSASGRSSSFSLTVANPNLGKL